MAAQQREHRKSPNKIQNAPPRKSSTISGAIYHILPEESEQPESDSLRIGKFKQWGDFQAG